MTDSVLYSVLLLVSLGIVAAVVLYIVSKKFIKSSGLETTFEDYVLKPLNYPYEAQYRIATKFYDFYIPSVKLLIEVDGDYWHANPKKYKADDIIGQSNKTAKKIWEYDKTKTQDILNEGYNILRYWSSDLKNISHEKIFEDIVHTSMKVEE